MSFFDCINTPETWRWAISTVVTVLSIFGAAYFAQRVFNKNARIREDRERRLQALQEILTNIHELASLQNKIEVANKDRGENWNRMLLITLKIHSINLLLKFGVHKDIKNVECAIKSLGDYLKENLSNTDTSQPIQAIDKSILSNLTSSTGALIKEVIRKFNSIEEKQ